MWPLKNSPKVWVGCLRSTTTLTIDQNSVLQLNSWPICNIELNDDDEETVFYHSDGLLSRTRRDTDDVKKIAPQLQGFDVFRLHMKSVEEDGDTNSKTIDKPLVCLWQQKTLYYVRWSLII